MDNIVERFIKAEETKARMNGKRKPKWLDVPEKKQSKELQAVLSHFADL